MSKEKKQICCCFIEEEKEMLNADVDTISEIFTFRYSQFCRKVNQLLCPKDCCKETTGRKWCKDYFSCRCDSDDICMCLYSSISVPFPVFLLFAFPTNIHVCQNVIIVNVRTVVAVVYVGSFYSSYVVSAMWFFSSFCTFCAYVIYLYLFCCPPK